MDFTRVRYALSSLARHVKYSGTVVAGMLLPTRRGRELAVRSYVVDLDINLEIPVIPFEKLFADQGEGNPVVISLRLGTSAGGSTNVFEQVVLSGLVKKIRPSVLLEIGTFKGGTTWHLHENSPDGAIVYTMDLPDGDLPDGITDTTLARNKARPYVPRSPRVRQILLDSRNWDGTLESGDRAQFVFIDGDHSYAGVKNDTEKALRCLDDYGCICWHDCLGKDFGYGTSRYLAELKHAGWKLFRAGGLHEISSVAVWMTDPLLDALSLTVPE